MQVGGHARLLASQALSVCLRRMDVMLFTALVSSGVDEPLPEAFSDVGGGALSEVTYLFPNLDEGVLPFPKVSYPLTALPSLFPTHSAAPAPAANPPTHPPPSPPLGAHLQYWHACQTGALQMGSLGVRRWRVLRPR